MSDSKRILSIPRSHLFLGQEKYFNGFIGSEISKDSLINLPPQHEDLSPYLMDRKDAENEPSFKQPIPYVVLNTQTIYGDAKDPIQFFFEYKRTKEGEEGRLHDLYSLGVGGHIGPEDLDSKNLTQTILNAAIREVREEVSFELDPERGDLSDRLGCIGYINDDDNSVGQVHLGIVYLLQLSFEESKTCKSNETQISECKWKHTGELMGHRDQYEPWSKLLYPALMNLGWQGEW